MSEASSSSTLALRVRDEWNQLSKEERLSEFRVLAHEDALDLFLGLDAHDAAELLEQMTANEQRLWIRMLAPDDAADVLQCTTDARQALLESTEPATRNEVIALMAYKEDEAGGLMSPRYARVRPEMTVAEAISYIRLQAIEQAEIIYYIYVLDTDQHLLGAVSLRDLFAAHSTKHVREIMQTELSKAHENMDQEALADLFAEEDLIAIPVVDANDRMMGIVTVDDIVDVVEEEATEDIQKMGGTEALDTPYLRSSLRSMIKKRAGWLTILFLGEMMTATAMGYYQNEIARAVVLALFLPLIISSGGNAGSQASTLVIRAMALGEVRLSDFWRVIRRELASGLFLGLILGSIGFCRVFIWEMLFHSYGAHYLVLALTVGISLVFVVLWGSLSGAFLPFILKGLRFDPASASTPFVATLVDVTGLVIYFTVASIILRGTLL